MYNVMKRIKVKENVECSYSKKCDGRSIAIMGKVMESGYERIFTVKECGYCDYDSDMPSIKKYECIEEDVRCTQICEIAIVEIFEIDERLWVI